jgi:RNA polymerase sigma-70 factor (ECF subfamily)
MSLDAAVMPGPAADLVSATARAVFEEEALPHRDALLATARRLTGRVDLAEDLVQETYLRAFRSAHRYRPGTNARAWLQRILQRARFDGMRESVRRPRTVVLTDEPGVAPAQHRLASGGDALERALATVPDHYRAALVLRDVKELSYEEIADVMGIPLGTVMSRIHRGRALLRTALGGRRP